MAVPSDECVDPILRHCATTGEAMIIILLWLRQLNVCTMTWCKSIKIVLISNGKR